jgi:fatty-acyl-CoA synthase
MLNHIVGHPYLKNDKLSNLEQIMVAASTIEKNTLQKAQEIFNVKHIIIGYGMTESSCLGSLTRTTDAPHKLDSIGQGIPSVELKIVDMKTNQIVPRNFKGEILIRGYNVMKGYWNDAERSAEAIDQDG